jgi:cysteine desulfurase
MRFDLENISVSMGAACSSGRIQVSRSLSRMGTDNSFAQSAIRVSSGWATQEKDLQKFANIWKKIYLELKETAA